MPMPMPENVRQTNMLRSVLLALAVLTMLCGLLAGGTVGLGKRANFFYASLLVENQTVETLTLTPITTTYAEPRVILQPTKIRQRDHVLKPNTSMLLTYDTADYPLAGIVICRDNDNCRMAESPDDETLLLDNINALPAADASWVAATQETGLRNYTGMLYIGSLLLSLTLFGVWWWLGKTQYNFG